jgi:hypothetical protein
VYTLQAILTPVQCSDNLIIYTEVLDIQGTKSPLKYSQKSTGPSKRINLVSEYQKTQKSAIKLVAISKRGHHYTAQISTHTRDPSPASIHHSQSENA